MRTLLRDQKRLTCRVATLALIAALGSGCSSGFSRFDSSLYSSAADPAAPNSSYVDPEATGSIARAPVPQGDIAGATSSGVPEAAGAQSYAAAAPAQSSIQRNSLPSPIANASTYNSAPLLAPATPRSGSIDPVNTASVASGARTVSRAAEPVAAVAEPVTATAARAAPAPAGAAAAAPAKGWTATGGTTIALREGETIYNLSKRYGVPVNAILAANNIKDAGAVQSGQNIVIPTYVYSRSAPVSAPDNDPVQQAASSARGQEVRAAAVDAASQTRQAATQATAATSATAAKAVTVAAGDSLNKIAARHGVPVDALRKANGLTGDNIRIGQVLSLPVSGGAATAAAGAAVATAAATANAAAGNAVGTATAAKQAVTDPLTTATAAAPAGQGPKPYVKPQTGAAQTQTASVEPAAPARTGIDEFRWPVRGRVISNFGETSANGRNDGIDISVPEGTAVKAAENGVVVYAGNELEGLGNLVLVRHADGWVTAYAHNRDIEVSRGDEVRRGQTIARSGRTGNADMPKLHFELRKNSTPVDPLKHLGGA